MFNQPKGTHRDFPFDLAETELSDDIQTSQLLGLVRMSRTAEGLLLQGDFSTHIPSICVRCLEEIEQPLHTQFTELYAFPKDLKSEQSSEDEPELVLSYDGYIDLLPLLREYLLLEIPIKPLCRSDCKGLCPHCGVNMNHVECHHSIDEADFSLLSPG